MENQEIMVAFAQAIQQVTAKVSALETTVQCLIAAQPAEQREQFGAALRQAASGLLAESDQRPLTGSALSHLKLAIDAYLEAAGQHPCNRDQTPRRCSLRARIAAHRGNDTPLLGGQCLDLRAPERHLACIARLLGDAIGVVVGEDLLHEAQGC